MLRPSSQLRAADPDSTEDDDAISEGGASSVGLGERHQSLPERPPGHLQAGTLLALRQHACSNDAQAGGDLMDTELGSSESTPLLIWHILLFQEALRGAIDSIDRLW